MSSAIAKSISENGFSLNSHTSLTLLKPPPGMAFPRVNRREKSMLLDARGKETIMHGMLKPERALLRGALPDPGQDCLIITPEEPRTGSPCGEHASPCPTH
jgi:hypothetical protein